MATDLFIVAAGKGSRMGGTLPKALISIEGKDPNIVTTLKRIGSKFRRVFIVTSVDVEPVWVEFISANANEPFISNVINVPIESGKGDGHAVREGLLRSDSIMGHISSFWREPFKYAEEVVICWGDAYIKAAEIVDEMLDQYRTANNTDGDQHPEWVSGVIPVVEEQEPYVAVTVDDKMMVTGADRSKYGEIHDVGFHDQSIFMFERNWLDKALRTCSNVYLKNGKFSAPGGELSLLQTFNVLYNIGQPLKAYRTKYPTLSFNTPLEVASIKQEIGNAG